VPLAIGEKAGYQIAGVGSSRASICIRYQHSSQRGSVFELKKMVLILLRIDAKIQVYYGSWCSWGVKRGCRGLSEGK
jgi:hypothetical protein